MMQKSLIWGVIALLMATGVFVTTAAAAPPKIQLQYLAFPGTCVGGSTGSMQLVVVNNGPTGSVAGSDHVLVSVPLGSVADDLLATTTGLSCGAESALWRCAIDSITATAAIVRLYPASGTVPVNAGETLYFYLDNTQINSAPGMAMLDVTQNIDPSRATTPVNTQMSVLKVTSTAAAYLEIDPTVPTNIKDGVDWSELSGIPSNLQSGATWSTLTGIPAGFADGVDNTGITAETDPTVPANIKDGISWGEISGIPASLQDGDQEGITTESDPQVGSNTANRVPKWDGSALVSSSSINENAAGNVGIGTMAPATKLVVRQATNEVNGGLAIENVGGIRGLYVWVDGSNKGRIDSGSGGDAPLILNSGGGNVGIDTSNPQSKLDVTGDAKVSGVLTSGKIQVVDVVTEGSSCSPNGLVARDSNGLLLSCQSGSWKKASGATGPQYAGEFTAAVAIAGVSIVNTTCTAGQQYSIYHSGRGVYATCMCIRTNQLACYL